MDALDTALLAKIKARVKERLQEKIDNLSQGRIKVWEDYIKEAAYIRALRDLDKLFEEARKEIER